MLKKLAILAAAMLLSTSVLAQSVQQSGTVTRNHIPVWNTSGVISDGGTSADSPITSLGVTNEGGAGFCVSSQRQTAAGRNQLCFNVSTAAAATISLQNFGNATAQVLNFVINGTTYPFPGALAGITINGTSVTGGVNGDCLIVNALTVGQIGCSIITAPTTGSGSVVFNTSPTLAGTIGGNLTWSGTQTYSNNNAFNAQAVFTGTTFPSQTVGNTLVGGAVSPPNLTANSQAYFFNTPTNGAMVQGLGTLFDVVLANKAGTPVLEVPTGQTNVTIPSGFTLSGLSNGSCTNGLGLNASNQAITVSCPGAASSIQVGTTTISSGSSGNLEFNNAGVLGELTPNGGIVKSGSNLQADPNYGGFTNQNCTLAASVSTNNLTVALKDNGGNDPSASSPCYLNFRSATASTGSTSSVAVTAATSFTANSGSTFGITNTAATCAAASSCPFRLWVTAINNAGTVVLSVTALSNASGVLPLNEGNVISATACNACGTAATLGTTYATATQTSKAFKFLGYLEWGSGLATAGTYASGPTFIQNMGPGIRKPGDVVQMIFASSTTAGSVTSTTYSTLTSGGFTLSITPTSTVNPILVETSGAWVQGATSASKLQMSRGTTAATNLFGSVAQLNSGGSGLNGPFSVMGLDTPNVTTTTTYAIQVKATSGSITSPSSGDPDVMIAREIMGALPELIPDNDNDPRLLNKVG